ncbi:Uncharacterised protein [Legionella londiniensis]|uniref:Uncharacterized protein n=2 Tax=Legionella londiniensis TaxID=45068 RepID=A0A0W0VJS5_9GAMM|nr:hypothetical protein Llon_1705 [Legionella londiniensis]STX93955.1 Uncharacterised protein [Legionella londiniensis]
MDIKMIRVLLGLGLIIISNLLTASPAPQSALRLTPCFNMNDMKQIGKQIRELLQQEFCEDQVHPKKFAFFSQNILSEIMTESFLGVAPPENWQQSTNDIIENCIDNRDLCKKEGRKKFEACLKPRIPLLLVQFGPWLVEHCPQLNQSVVQQWPNKKEILKNVIDESKAQKNPAL